MNLSNMCSAIRVSNAVAAGSTDVTSAAIDMQGYQGALIIFAFGTITAGAVTSCLVHQSSDDGDADAYTALLGSGVTVADDDDNQIVIIDVYKPRERYLKAVIDRATQNAVVDGIFVLRYDASKQPATNDSATVVGREIHRSPAEGSA